VLPPRQEGHCRICVQAFKAVLDSLHAFRHVHLIVATRWEAPAVAGVGWGAAAVELRALDADAGMQLLESRLGPAHNWTEADKQTARKLVEEVQGNPLVLSVAVGLVLHGKDFTWQVRRTTLLSFAVRVGVTCLWCSSCIMTCACNAGAPTPPLSLSSCVYCRNSFASVVRLLQLVSSVSVKA
jgi:hypothetical protein